ncbi:MAG: cell division protein [Brevundimonas sp.]|uniref:cell division protein FtsL n=1 Tax=Brevundimonas sp. TaxID=1871086 RepID=UPI0025C3407D|nr:cell division protein [Brevundimonas sp.]MBX3477595.1 cell division protein [Brevundimonas sp.]
MSALNPVQRLFDWKIRGVRWVEIIGVVCVALMILSVYVAKAAAARESARIGDLQREISANRERVRLLRAEVTRLEQPARLEALSRGIGMAPLDSRRQAGEAALTELAPDPAVRAVAPAPAAPTEPEAGQ